MNSQRSLPELYERFHHFVGGTIALLLSLTFIDLWAPLSQWQVLVVLVFFTSFIAGYTAVIARFIQDHTPYIVKTTGDHVTKYRQAYIIGVLSLGGTATVASGFIFFGLEALQELWKVVVAVIISVPIHTLSSKLVERLFKKDNENNNDN